MVVLCQTRPKTSAATKPANNCQAINCQTGIAVCCDRHCCASSTERGRKSSSESSCQGFFTRTQLEKVWFAPKNGSFSLQPPSIYQRAEAKLKFGPRIPFRVRAFSPLRTARRFETVAIMGGRSVNLNDFTPKSATSCRFVGLFDRVPLPVPDQGHGGACREFYA